MRRAAMNPTGSRRASARGIPQDACKKQRAHAVFD